MPLLVLALISGAPLLIASAAWLTLAHPDLGLAVPVGGLSAVLAIAAAIQLAVVCGVRALYRWCFESPSARAACLLASLIALVLMLSHPPLLKLYSDLLSGAVAAERIGALVVRALVDALTLTGVTLAVTLILTLLVELPLRWAQSGAKIFDDGFFRVARCLGVLVFGTMTLSMFREEGLLRLAEAIRQAVG
jgi:hypothetical protein